MARILIGTSGWDYGSWRGPFYPKAVTLKKQLAYYASQFQTTELNGVFYRTPTPEAVKGWRRDTGKEFVFSWKASQFITHWKRLSQNSVNSLELLESRLSLLGDKAGPVLFQLPPNFALNHERLASFLELLSNKRRYSFEFRNPSWYDFSGLSGAFQAQYFAVSVGSPSGSGAMEAHRRFRLRQGSRPARPIQRSLHGCDAATMGAALQGLEEAGLRRLRLFRQRPEKRGAG